MITGPKSSRGIALLTVLLVVSIASIISVSLVKRQWIDIRKTQNTLRTEQSWLYAQGIEAWGLGRLKEDMKQVGNATDSAQDTWNKPIIPTKVEGGELSATISDLQGRFNINSLLAAASNDQGDNIHQDRFRRLLGILEIPVELYDPLIDWLDSNDEIQYPNGAEESHYLSKSPPYRPANGEIADISELRLIDGFTDEVMALLAPHVTALPGITDINVNTATAEVLRCLDNGIGESDAQLLIDRRTEEPFKDSEDFTDEDAVSDAEVSAIGLAVSSKYFVVNSEILVDQLKLSYRSIILRENITTIRVTQRSKRGSFSE